MGKNSRGSMRKMQFVDITGEKNQETKGVLREGVGVHGRPEVQQKNSEEMWNLDGRGWDAKWKVKGLKEWTSKRKILRKKDYSIPQRKERKKG